MVTGLARCTRFLGHAELPIMPPEPQIMAMPLTVPSSTTDDLSRFPADGNRYELLEGQLLVTPAPGSVHQVVLSRLQSALRSYLLPAGLAQVVSPGEIEIAPRTLLDPDLLVFPASFLPGTPWARISGWWLAVEVFSRSSRIYDRYGTGVAHGRPEGCPLTPTSYSGGLVRMRGPSRVTATVCSKCAESLPSAVTTVHLSARVRVS